MTTMPHGHYCPHCELVVPCHVAENGGCIFASTSPMTCEPCAVRLVPLPGEQGRLAL